MKSLIIDNHQYNENIEILKKIYSTRFSNIYHLVPFYKGKKSNIVPVYENSFYFQGYVAQGYKSYFKNEYTHSFFLADDMILNPIINESNYSKHLKLEPDTSFLPEFISLHKCKECWHGVYQAYHWNVNVPRVDAENQLPNSGQTLQRFKDYGLDIKLLRFARIWGNKLTPPQGLSITQKCVEVLQGIAFAG